MNRTGTRPLVWYVAAGYPLPAGIEAHVLHYATEMRNHGFDTRVVVFKELPAEKHRFWKALEARGIAIDSAYERGRPAARFLRAALLVPWLAYTRLWRRARLPVAGFRLWATRRAGMRAFRRLMRAERPDLVHVFGRLPTEAWRELPAARTIFHEMMTGTVDQHWTEAELSEFRAFAERAARYFAPGEGVAANVRREFRIQRRIDPIFTMCPDEVTAEQGTRNSEWRQADMPAGTSASPAPSSEVRVPRSALRFGVICRLTGQKGITYLLDALRLYRDRHGAVDFTFGGIGPMEERIREFVDSNGLANVRIIRVDSAPAVLGRFDVFVHPSVDDAMPVAIAEALMCGKPCIVCRVGGCADLVRDGMEGYVLEPRQTEAIVAAMERFAALSPDAFEDFRRRARARFEAVCLPASVGTVMASHYRDILGAPPAGA